MFVITGFLMYANNIDFSYVAKGTSDSEINWDVDDGALVPSVL